MPVQATAPQRYVRARLFLAERTGAGDAPPGMAQGLAHPLPCTAEGILDAVMLRRFRARMSACTVPYNPQCTPKSVLHLRFFHLCPSHTAPYDRGISEIKHPMVGTVCSARLECSGSAFVAPVLFGALMFERDSRRVQACSSLMEYEHVCKEHFVGPE